jgi:hypothetical protein
MVQLQLLLECKDAMSSAEVEVGPEDAGNNDMSKKGVNASGWSRTNVSVISHPGRRLHLPCPPGPIRQNPPGLTAS